MLTKLLGLFATIGYIVLKVLERFKEERLVQQGKNERDAELNKSQLDKERQQTEVLLQDRTKEDTVKRLEDGTF